MAVSHARVHVQKRRSWVKHASSTPVGLIRPDWIREEILFERRSEESFLEARSLITRDPFLPDTPRDSSLLTIPCSKPTWSKFKSCWLFFYSRYLNIYFSWRVINQRVSPKYLWNRVWKVNFPLFHCPWIALTRAERSLRRDKEAAKKGKEGERNGLGWKGKKK